MSLSSSTARLRPALRLRWEWVALAAITAVAAFLRLYRLDTFPPGVHFDEAVYGLQAEYILKGHFPVYFSAYNGREPLYMYLVALVYLFTGPGTWGLRLATALIGIATVPLAYLALRELLGRRVALLAATLIATSYWHLAATRIAFSANVMPLAESIAIYLLWRGYRDGKLWLLALGGAATALNLYVYLASRFFPITLGFILVYLLLVDRQRLRQRWLGLLLALLVAFLVFAPLGIHFLRVPQDFWERADQVLAWKGEGESSFVSVVVRNARRMILTFLPRLDSSYGLLGRPVLDPLVGPFFLLGVGLVLWRWRRPEYGILLFWWFGMALPPLFTVEPYPVSQRVLGIVPPLYGLVALGLGGAWRWASGRPAWARAVPVAVAAILAGEAIWGSLYCFTVWAPSPATYYWFHSDVTAVGRLMRPELQAGHRVVIAAEHYHHPSVVITEPASLSAKWVQGRQLVVLPAWDGREIDYFVPLSDARPIAAARRVLEDAACAREEFSNHLGDAVVALYRICRPPAIKRPAAPLVTFADEVALWSVDMPETARRGKALRVGIQWEVLRAVNAERCISVHLVDSQGLRWSQVDQLGYLHPEWQPGDQVWQWLEVPLPATIPPGTYHVRLILAGEEARARPVHNAQGGLAGLFYDAGAVRLREEQRWIEPATGQVTRLGPLQVLAPAPINVAPRPGERFLAEVTWQAVGTLAGPLSAELELRADDGRPVAHWSYPLATEYPAARWQQGELVRQRYLLSLPPNAPEGRYTLWLAVSGHEGAVSLGKVQVPRIDRVMVPPPMQHTLPSPLTLGGQVELLGYDLEQEAWRPDEPIRLTLYWRALAPMEMNYTVFVHLLNEQGEIVAQRDVGPADGARPTSGWLTGEIIADTHTLQPTEKGKPGSYRLAVGMYDQQTLARLEMRTPKGERVADDRLMLAELRQQ